MMVITHFLVWLVAILVGMFVFRRRLKDEVEEDKLWTVMIQSVVAGLIIGRIGWWLWQLQHSSWQWVWLWRLGGSIDIWGLLIGMGFVLWLSKERALKVIGEGGDALVEAMGWGIWVVVSCQLSVFSWRFYVNLLVISIGLWLWYWVKKNYRKFRWYQSGRVGFLWWAGVILVAIGQLLIFTPPQIGGWRGGALLYNVIPMVLGVWGIYRLSGRGLIEDQTNVVRNWKVSLTKMRQNWRHRLKR